MIFFLRYFITIVVFLGLATQTTLARTLSPKDVMIEKNQLERLQSAFKELPKAQQVQRLESSKTVRAAALEQYQKQKFREAQQLFIKALKINPLDVNNYLDLGICYYRLEQHHEAITKFLVSENIVPNDREDERKFFLGLTYMKMQEDAMAKITFQSLVSSTDPIFTPSSHFYLGALAMKEKNYDSALKHFESVLDSSKDPQMDAKAEEYIEKILQYKQLEESRRKKLKASINGSTIYDSNVLYSPDGEDSQGVATNSGGFRLGVAGLIDYKIFQTDTSSWNARYTTSLMYSLDEAFISSDPFAHNIKMPYSMTGKWGEKNYNLSFSPGYDFVYMDANSTGSRFSEIILSSLILTTNLVLLKDSKKISYYTLDLRNDDSKLITDVTTDADAFKVSLSSNQRYSLNPQGTKSFSYGIGMSLNTAKGIDKKYHKMDFSSAYSSPLSSWEDAIWNIGLSVYQQNYPEHSSQRKDFNITFNGAIARPINKDWNWSSVLSYSNNASNISRNQYSKYTITGNINYNWSE